MRTLFATNSRRVLPLWAALALLLAGCATPAQKVAPTAPSPAPPAAPAPAPAPVPVPAARIKGSEETSTLLDNFTAFVSAIDGQSVAAGRKGWDSTLEIIPGRRLLRVEFNRGVFVAQATLELQATPAASYEVRFATDAQLFGHNSYCDFWIVDTASGKTVTVVKKAPVSRKP